MRLATRSRWEPARLQDGSVVSGYLLEAPIDLHTGVEQLYAVRSRDGAPGTLVASSRRHADRRERARVRRLAARRMELKHPALIGVRAFGEHGGQPYLITEPYPARTLGHLLDEGGRIEPRELVEMLEPVAAALDLAHACGLVHQSFSGSSLRLGDEGLQLDSFGVLTSDPPGDWGMVPLPELLYQAPELLRGDALSPAGNVYSLAALVVHALTGAPPYGGERPAVVYGHLADPPPRVSERAPNLRPELDDVIAWGMAKVPWQRPPSAAALMYAVAGALGMSRRLPVPRTPSAPPAESAPSERSQRRRVGVAVAAAVASAAVCGVLAAALVDPFGGGEPSRPVDPAVAGVWKRLESSRPDLRAQLAAAETPQDQAAAARELAAAYDDAVRALPATHAAAAAGAAAEAYSDLAEAAEAGDASSYSDAAVAVAGAEGRLWVVSRH